MNQNDQNGNAQKSMDEIPLTDRYTQDDQVRKIDTTSAFAQHWKRGNTNAARLSAVSSNAMPESSHINNDLAVRTTEEGLAEISAKISQASTSDKNKDKFVKDELIADRYRVIKVLGEGGFGVVYLCENIADNNKRVAVKTLRHAIPDYEKAAKRFEREIKVCGILNNEHTIKVIDAGTAKNDTLFYVMELLQGTSMEEFVERHERFSLYETKYLMLQVLESIREAHQKGIVHRDLKPSNISLEPKPDVDPETHDFDVRVLDFGIAKIINDYDDDDYLIEDEKLTKTGAWVGSPSYMSPELLRADAVTPSADVYALGLIMYEMISAHVALYGNGSLEIAVQQMAPEEHVLDDWIVESSFGPIIQKCIRKKREERYQNAGEVYDALAALDDQLIKKEFSSAKMRRFSGKTNPRLSTVTGQASASETGVSPVSPTMSGLTMEGTTLEGKIRLGVIIGIIILVTIIASFGLVKLYLNKQRAEFEAKRPPMVQMLKSHEQKLIVGAAIGAFKGANELPRVEITIACSIPTAQIYMAKEDRVIGKCGDTLNFIRTREKVELVVKAEGFNDYTLPITPLMPQTQTVQMMRIMPPPGMMPPPNAAAQPDQAQPDQAQPDEAQPETKPEAKPTTLKSKKSSSKKSNTAQKPSTPTTTKKPNIYSVD